jgi:hypothetical protein
MASTRALMPPAISATPLADPCAEYAAMQEFFRQRADELGLSRTTIDRLANFTPGLASKFLSPTPIKRIGHEHIGPLCAALAVAWIPVEDAQSRAELNRRIGNGSIEKRNGNLAMHAALSVPARSRRFMRRIARKGGKSRAQKLSPERRSEIARNAAKELWKTRAATACPRGASAPR